jgi:hypothetical protein
MSAVCVLTPLVVASWPVLSSAIVGAAASLGFAVRAEALYREAPSRRKVETEIENSEVVADALGRGQKICLQKDDITIEFGQDERGACRVCVTGDRHSERELRQIGAEVAGRVVQQFAYHKLMTELKRRHYAVVEEQVLQDQSVHVRVRL